MKHTMRARLKTSIKEAGRRHQQRLERDLSINNTNPGIPLDAGAFQNGSAACLLRAYHITTQRYTAPVQLKEYFPLRLSSLEISKWSFYFEVCVQ